MGKITTEEQLTEVNSKKRARRVVDEIIGSGGYVLEELLEGLPVYSRDLGDKIEKLAIRKIAQRRYEIIKITIC